MVLLELADETACYKDMLNLSRLTDGSWRRMHVSQTPCFFDWELTGLRTSGLRTLRGRIGDSNDVQTVEDLLEALTVSKPSTVGVPPGLGGQLPRTALSSKSYRAPAPEDFQPPMTYVDDI